MAGGKKGGVNQKAAVGRAKKDENEAKKQEAEQRKLESQEAEEWKKGANVKKLQKAEEEAQKADEIARKKREKQALLEAEEAEIDAKGTKKPGPPPNSKKKTKKKDDLALLEDVLVKGADKKVRAKKEAEKKKQEEQKRQQEEAAEKDSTPLDPLMANTQAMIGDSADDEEVGRQANKARMESEGTSGLDGAFKALDISAPSEVKSAKALYKEFEERMLPEMKDEFPGLRLSQYKEKIFNLWKKSPENPANQQPTS